MPTPEKKPNVASEESQVLTQTESGVIAFKAKPNVLYEGGRAGRTNAVIDAINRLNKAKDEWKYTIGEKSNVRDLPEDGIDRLLHDGYEIVDANEAKRLIGFELKGGRVLMRVARAQHEIYVKEAIRLATAPTATPEADGVNMSVEEQRKLVTISE